MPQKISKLTKEIIQKLRIPFDLFAKITNQIKERFGFRGNSSINTPPEFADVIRYFIEEKRVCDIGSHLGHFMIDMANTPEK